MGSALFATYVPGKVLSLNAYNPVSQVTFTNTSATLAALSVAGTTVGITSNGGEISTIATWSSPSAGVLAVASIAGYPTAGTLTVAASGPTTAIVTYTGISGSTFTGCAYVSGSATGTVATGGAIALSGVSVNTGNFTAPASGNVLVTANLVIDTSASADGVGFALAAHGSVTPVIGNVISFKTPVTTQPFPYQLQFYVTGLTSGTTYNFDLLNCIGSAGTLNIFANTQTGTTPNVGNTGVGSPIIMTVQGN